MPPPHDVEHELQAPSDHLKQEKKLISYAVGIEQQHICQGIVLRTLHPQVGHNAFRT